jgi:hypothetical protein
LQAVRGVENSLGSSTTKTGWTSIFGKLGDSKLGAVGRHMATESFLAVGERKEVRIRAARRDQSKDKTRTELKGSDERLKAENELLDIEFAL